MTLQQINQIKQYDTDEYMEFTGKSELSKALNTLCGLLQGICLDRNINELEIMEILNWCSLHKKVKNTPPFNEIIPLVEKSLEDNILTQDEIEDIIWCCKNYQDEEFYKGVTADIQKLEGILHGLLADNVLKDEEVYSLRNWIDENEQLKNTYPFEELDSLLLSILDDREITDDEKDKLKAFMSEFIDIKKSYNIIAKEYEELRQKSSIIGICSACPDVQINNKTFCFTGKSSKHTRIEIMDIINKLGGKFSNSLTKDVDYLMVGNEGNDAWTFTCYGRKVEQAMEHRRKGRGILIIHENDFWDAVADNKI